MATKIDTVKSETHELDVCLYISMDNVETFDLVIVNILFIL